MRCKGSKRGELELSYKEGEHGRVRARKSISEGAGNAVAAGVLHVHHCNKDRF